MNPDILNQYGIAFHKLSIDGELVFLCKQVTVSDLSYCLCGYLTSQPTTDYLSEELLVEIEKAIQNLSYNKDGGGEDISLEIAFPMSNFISGGGNFKITPSIPTIDLKKIITLWISFLNC